MRTRPQAVLTVLAVAVALLLSTGAPAGAAARDTGAAPSVTVTSRASALYLFDGSAAGTGPRFPATTVTARLTGCPAGASVLLAELRQGGVEMNWATSARGAGEIVCTGGESLPLTMGFYGPTLRPGMATATFGIVHGDTVVSVTRPVRIPAVGRLGR